MKGSPVRVRASAFSICRDFLERTGALMKGSGGLLEVYVSEVLLEKGQFAGLFPHNSLSDTSLTVVLSVTQSQLQSWSTSRVRSRKHSTLASRLGPSPLSGAS